ncbi:MAG: MarR family transcriptional regulator [Clostridia bacterium]|nr:MarR family transcriptional regulator [Clostridia bacterium]
MQNESTREKLLDAWLNLTSTLWNTRIVSSMTFNECHILGILLRQSNDTIPQTATDLIARTHLLKSQMNKILTTLEGKGYITRKRAAKDKRLMYLHPTPEGQHAYLREHERINAFLDNIINRIGETRAGTVADELNAIIGVLGELLPVHTAEECKQL